MAGNTAVDERPSAPISQRAYARHRGVAVRTVQLAIQRGRLVRSLVTVNGAAKIADVALADREWAENTRVDPVHKPTPRQKPQAPASDAAPVNGQRSDYQHFRALTERYKAEQAELEVRKRRGELVVAADLERELASLLTRVRTRLLAVPSQCAQRIPGLTAAQVRVIEDLQRDALTELASDD